jgi:hypothetical protein
MNNYEDWAQLVAKKLEHESTLLAAIDKEELDDAAACEAFLRAVLEPFLPENFGIGAGRIVDAYGNCSDYLEIIVYNRDFPRIGMRGTHSAFLYESVLAAFSIRAKFIRKTFFESLNACASLARLATNVDKAALVKLAAKNGLKAGPNKTFVHQDPLRTERFELIGRPPAFVFGFSGFKYSYRQLQENIELWFESRVNSGIPTPMKCLPAVIATQGCFAWRNAAPLALSNREMLGVGADDAPIRLIVLQLLYLLNRRLQVNSVDGYGLKPSLNAYLSHFSAPKFEVGVGNIAKVVNLKQGKPAEAPAAADKPKPNARAAEPKKAAPAAEPKAPEPAQAKRPAPAVKPAEAAKPAPAAPKPPPAPKQQASSESSGVFDKPSPFASKPRPPETATEDGPEPKRWSAPKAPLGSAPIPQDSAPAADKAPPRAPLGSAPIPRDSAPEPEPAPASPAQEAARPREPAAAVQVTPPKPPVDFPLGGDEEKPAEAQAGDDEFSQTLIIPPEGGDGPKAEAQKPAAGQKAAESGNSGKPADTDFESTLVIPPDASISASEKSKNSGDAFIARVKEQLSSSEPIGDDKKDFTSTIPQ